MNTESVRKILIGLVTDAEFLSEYTKLFPEPIFKSILGARTIEKWCLNYYNKYSAPISVNIGVMYDKSVQGKWLTPEELQYVEALLTSISNESDTKESTPVDYLLDLAVAEANAIKLKDLHERVEDGLERGSVKDALEAYEQFKKYERGEELPRVNLLEDGDKVAELVLASGVEPFLKPNPNSPYEREVFSQILPNEYTILRAKSKGFKTFSIYNLALSAILQKKNVLLFSLGDLNLQMSIKRLIGLLLHKPTLETHANKLVKVAHIDCYKNKFNTCLNINRVGTKAYMDENGVPIDGYERCTACAKCNRAFPVCITHTFENSGDLLTDEEAKKVSTSLKSFVGEGGVFDFYSFSACSKTVNDIADIVGTYYEKGQKIDLVLIDYWGQLKVPRGCERLPMHEQVTQQAVDLKNMCLKYGVACAITDQATIRAVDAGMTSDDMLNDSSYTGSQNKITYTTSCINTSVQKEDRRDGTIKVHVTNSRYGYGDTIGDGYILTTCPVGIGKFAAESIHVTSKDIKEIDEFKKEHGLDDDTGKKKKRKK